MSNWINVNDELPAPGSEVLIYCAGMISLTAYFGPQYDEEWDEMDSDEITHWMPLPERPEDEAYRVDSVVGPRRIQRKRIRGWKMPENTVSVCRPGKFGNPFLVTEGVTQAEAVTAFRIWLMGDSCMAGMPERKQQILDGLPELRGKNLACYCEEGTPCHADVLLELANS